MVARLERLAIILIITLAASWPPAPAAAAPLLQAAPCATAVATAIAQRGKPYVWGAKGPDSFDCSGLTSYAWGQAGYSIGISTWDQMYSGQPISCTLADLAGASTTCWLPGDLIFLRDGGSQHVAIYVGEGLIADAYNSSSGVIIHKVELDGYYQEHFWQARRITSCSGVSVSLPGTIDSPSQLVGLEEIPDLLPSVSYQVPQCGTCNPDGSIYFPPTEWGETWPSGWESLNPAAAFQKVISWLAWQIREIIRQLICWLLSMLQMLLNALALLVNAILVVLNALWKIQVGLWLMLKSWFYAFWDAMEWFRQFLIDMLGAVAALGPILSFLWEMFNLIGRFIGDILGLIWLLASIILGLIGWVGGLALGLWMLIITALGGSTIPVQLTGDPHPVYYMVRGGLEAILDSPLGWMYWLTVAAIYVGFIFWMSLFLSNAQD